MKQKDLFVFLSLEVVAIAVAGASFALIPSRLIAGLVAGAYFILFSAWMLGRIWRMPDRWRVLTLYPLLIHLFVVSLPMVVTRLLHADADFSDVRIWGLPGPAFHHLSTNVFSVLMVATVVDLILAYVRNARAKSSAARG